MGLQQKLRTHFFVVDQNEVVAVETSPKGRQVIKIGRPRVTDRDGFDRSFGAILERLSSGYISRCRAAKDLGIGYATLKRLLDGGYLCGGSK